MLSRMTGEAVHVARAAKGNSLVSTVNDLILGGGAATSPIWLSEVTAWAQDGLIIGGAFLLFIRILLALITLYRTIRDRDKIPDTSE